MRMTLAPVRMLQVTTDFVQRELNSLRCSSKVSVTLLNSRPRDWVKAACWTPTRIIKLAQSGAVRNAVKQVAQYHMFTCA
jgi:hypothetical protein